jgi:hypothetical protein
MRRRDLYVLTKVNMLNGALWDVLLVVGEHGVVRAELEIVRNSKTEGDRWLPSAAFLAGDKGQRTNNAGTEMQAGRKSKSPGEA